LERARRGGREGEDDEKEVEEKQEAVQRGFSV
jgi:hypothetical protein